MCVCVCVTSEIGGQCVGLEINCSRLNPELDYRKRNKKIKTHVLSRALAILSYITDDRDYKRVN